MWFIAASWWGIQYLCACTLVACEQAYYDSQSKPQENMRAGRVSGDVTSGWGKGGPLIRISFRVQLRFNWILWLCDLVKYQKTCLSVMSCKAVY